MGLHAKLESKAVEIALRGLRSLPDNVYVSVNVSPATIIDGQFQIPIDDMPLGRIVLEITEHATVEHYDAIAERLADYRRRGLRIAVDDAGAGYASFRHILSLQPDIIKLDMSITRNIDTDVSRRALAAALVGFSSAVGSKIVAEGVETEAELNVLRDLGITKAQGYFLGRPASLEVARSLLQH